MKLKSKLKKTLLGIAAFILVIGAWYLHARNSGDTTIIISKATTYITEPLDENGDVDFIAYFNRNRIPAKSNIVAGLWEAIHGEDDLDGILMLHDQYFEALGWDTEGLDVASKDPMLLFESPEYPELRKGNFRGLLCSAPWKRDRSPRMDRFVQSNKERIRLAIEAFSRGELFEPAESAFGMGPGIRLIQKTATALSLLSCREFRERPEESIWEDVLKVRRGLRRIRAGCSVELTLLQRFDNSLAKSIAHLAQYASSLDALQDYARETVALKDFRLSPQAALAADRLSLIPVTIELFGYDTFWESPSSTVGFESVLKTLGGGSCDWNRILTRINERYDEFLEFASVPRSERKAAFTRLRQASSSRQDEIGFLSALLFVSVRSDMVAEQLYEDILGTFMRTLERIEDAKHKNAVNEIALHVAVFKLKNGHYPSSLDEISAKLPTGPYTKKLPEYEKTKDGFMLWSFGLDGQKDLFRGKYTDKDDYRFIHPVSFEPEFRTDVVILDREEADEDDESNLVRAIRQHKKRIAKLRDELKEFELSEEDEDEEYESQVRELDRQIHELSERLVELEHWARYADSEDEKAKADAAANAEDSDA